ncbi:MULTISPECIES: glycine zipper 2TM domain-containing protein [Pseudoxanthomonas]|uniref:Glycine zipper 2TM domain-containing protein n=1 Tax=Pseudoxanthomonas winnipegensis TaxID=2480810 RepID=A0A4V2HCU6_9GAMM|nr:MULTISPECIES: glycine zipper 2TM domain-containing protein [Pseudoxanthomonas]TAA23723.1 glycine zipper 2TM domain-containing protein [Pseudoxanthomonas winnipegensis]TMN17906.1 glycine zipper 2TM domain-containing protein [Pseudoxanthomonas sp. X-1]UAY76460.1 glycine zipper 2TM domain-containing protein [Pseudoxanthomonas sp. X-1]
MKNTTTLILVGAGALLFGGVATAAYMNHRTSAQTFATTPEGEMAATTPLENGDAMPVSAVPTGTQVDYADIVNVVPITQRGTLYATVIGTDPVRETTTTTTPREVCQDVVVNERLPERDGNVGGTVAGALIGGLVGHQIGGGNGRDLATAAGAVAGGFAGNRIDRNHVGGRVVQRTERQCHTENATSESSRVTGYNVTYRNPDGTTGTMRMDEKPGSRIAMGKSSEVTGYNVTYRYDGTEKTVRLDRKPDSDRLPVIDGRVVTQTAALDSSPRG